MRPITQVEGVTMKTYRDFNGKSFFRKLGYECLRRYIQDVAAHPLHDQLITGLLETTEPIDMDQFLDYFDSSDNPNREIDMLAFALINDLAGEKGLAQMRNVCEE